ncbi:MAG: WD40 repeat domain-containing protein, partial [Verrucomicrobiales bacterium]|nr:WD40 repeat domain-containing protein [Verrucomicrobiales bacterium]
MLVFAAATELANAIPITALAFSPDGAVLVSSGARSLEVRSPNDGAVQRRIPCDLSKISSLAFQSPGRCLAVGGGNAAVSGEVLLFDWRKEKLLHRLTNHTDLATCVAFNRDGTLLGIASADHSARVWRVEKDAAIVTEAFALIGHAGPVLAIAFSPSARSVATASADRSIKVWSTEDGRLLRTFSHHTESVHALVFRPPVGADFESSPAVCASGSDDRTVRIWQPEIGRMVRIIRSHQGSIFALVFAPDGKSLYSAGKEGVVRRLDPDSDTVLAQWPAHGDWIYAMAFSPDGLKLASGDWSGSV